MMIIVIVLLEMLALISFAMMIIYGDDTAGMLDQMMLMILN